MTDKMIQNTINIIGCGYIGKKLLQQFLLRQTINPAHLFTLVKSAQSQQQCAALGVSSVQYDMDDPRQVLPDKLATQASILYYFAPPPATGTVDTRARQFLKQLEQKAPARIVLISTTGVYGDCHGRWVDETTAIKPVLDRAQRRADAEQQFQCFCQRHHIPLVILRVSGIYDSQKLPLERIRSKTPIVRQQDSPFSNRIHSEDLVEICFKAGLSDTIEGIYNCADGHPTSMYDYFIKVARSHHLPAPPSISIEQAQTQLSSGMLSYMAESRRIAIDKLLADFQLQLKYPDLDKGLAAQK